MFQADREKRKGAGILQKNSGSPYEVDIFTKEKMDRKKNALLFQMLMWNCIESAERERGNRNHLPKVSQQNEEENMRVSYVWLCSGK